jgi:anhydro-N-acetylmuramic acid kinase
VLLNIGGIANFTWLPAGTHQFQPFATDTGPGNTLLDRFAQIHFGLPYDKNARLAHAGIVDQGLLDVLKSEPFFQAALPKTIGPELFSERWVTAVLAQLPKGSPAHNPYNLMATLSALTAETIAEAVRSVAADLHGSLYLSGGGAHNPFITSMLRTLLPHWAIRPMQDLGVPGDAKEAILFAVLANECIAGQSSGQVQLGGIPLVSMGKISLPG